jgi:hypothetical protein
VATIVLATTLKQAARNRRKTEKIRRELEKIMLVVADVLDHSDDRPPRTTKRKPYKG